MAEFVDVIFFFGRLIYKRKTVLIKELQCYVKFVHT